MFGPMRKGDHISSRGRNLNPAKGMVDSKVTASNTIHAHDEVVSQIGFREDRHARRPGINREGRCKNFTGTSAVTTPRRTTFSTISLA